MYIPHGVLLSQWVPQSTGAGFEFTPILKPLEPYRDKLTLVTGLTAGPTVQNGGHAVAPASYLTGNVQPKQTEGSDVLGAVTIDQVIAKAIGQDTPFPSLEIATEDFSTSIGACDTGYSCIYMNTIAWAGPTSPLPMETNPRVVFERMFGGAGTAEQRLARLQENRSILDGVVQDGRARSRAASDRRDRTMLSDYLENVREIERRIGRAEDQANRHPVEFAAPVGPPEVFDEHVALHFDLMATAFQADVTRVFTFMMMRDVTGRSFPHIGVSDPHHALSHEANGRSNDPNKPVNFAKVNTHFVSMFAKFVEKLRATRRRRRFPARQLDAALRQRHGQRQRSHPPSASHGRARRRRRADEGAWPAPGVAGRSRWPTCCWHWPRRPARLSSGSATATGRSTSERRLTCLQLLTIVFLARRRARRRPCRVALRRRPRRRPTAVRALIAAKADVNATEVDGSTALHLAVDAGDEETARLLLAAGARATAATRYGVTPLALAARNGSPGADRGAGQGRRRSQRRVARRRDGAHDGDALRQPGRRAEAAGARRQSQRRGVLARADGADVGGLGEPGRRCRGAPPGRRRRERALEGVAGPAAAAEGSATSFQSAHSNFPKGGFTALHFAAQYGSGDVAALLAEAGANLEATEPDGVTPLIMAIINGHYDVAAVLVRKGANVNAVDRSGRGALYHAVDMNTLEWLFSRPNPQAVRRTGSRSPSRRCCSSAAPIRTRG